MRLRIADVKTQRRFAVLRADSAQGPTQGVGGAAISPFLLKIALSFLLAGVWVSSSTLLAERLGSKKAGLITNLPSNIVLSLIFMALTSGPTYAAQTTRGIPIGMAIDTIFILAFILALRWGLWLALAVSFLVWAASALTFVLLLPPLGTMSSLLFYAAVLAICFLLADRPMAIRMVARKPTTFSWGQVAIRGLFAGTVVAGAVTVAQFAPPYMTGIVATFPAVLSTTLVILTLGQGPAFARATGKILIVTSSNIIVYAAVVGATFVPIGPWIGSALAFCASLAYIAVLSKIVARIR